MRQDGSHIRLTTQRGGEHHVTVPNHNRSRWAHWPRSLRRLPCITG
ncbi:MAG: hypothetical protein ACREH8_07905 [Opitutaceae bacterium]